MKVCKLLIIISIIFAPSIVNSNETIAYIDQKFIYSNSLAGKSIKAQLEKFQNKMIKKLTDNKKLLADEESKLIAQKNVLQPEEYKKKLLLLEKKIISHNKKRNENTNILNKKQFKGNLTLKNFLTPILATYSEENSISFIIDKQYIVIGKSSLDVTADIVKLLDNKVKTIKLD
tara:strand:- start:38 stop:559 length:522 start_codon:yes stop_codon:yes gene_type:complete